MSSDQIRFDDGAAYERYMGKWSQRVGDMFLDWLAPVQGWRWLDVGCGNGAFTETILRRCAPASITGIDPSAAQLDFARTRPALSAAEFQQGDAMSLPFPDDAFDAAVMPLVIFFVPEPGRGVAEMARVVRAGGSVSAYAWDMLGGGFPYEPLHEELRDMGFTVPMPPSPEAAQIDSMQRLWAAAGLQDISTKVCRVQRTFADFDDYWTTILGAPSAGATLAIMSADQIAQLEARMRARLPPDGAGHITCSGWANAVKGRVPD